MRLPCNRRVTVSSAIFSAFLLFPIMAAADPLIGQWSLDLPSGEAGWLAVEEGSGTLEVRLMWAVGSPRQIKGARIENGELKFVRRDFAVNRDGTRSSRETITARAEGDRLHLKLVRSGVDGTAETWEFSGKRQPPIPSRPDLSQVKFGEPIVLFNGRDLDDWRVSNPAKKNGWSVRDGVLCNDTPKTDFSAYGEYANLRTDTEFEDFRLHIEYRLPPGTGGNSGIYLRGLYEVQVTHRDSKMQGINGPGAVFGRITPSHNAGKPAGEWESLDLTLVARHVTVVLNGQKVIDNQPVEGCTGGALYSDVTRPGPIYLQGDHTSVQYRNIVLYPAT